MGINGIEVLKRSQPECHKHSVCFNCKGKIPPEHRHHSHWPDGVHSEGVCEVCAD